MASRRTKMAAGHRKPAWALDAGGPLGKMDGRPSLDRFQAHCNWEMSVCTAWLPPPRIRWFTLGDNSIFASSVVCRFARRDTKCEYVRKLHMHSVSKERMCSARRY